MRSGIQFCALRVGPELPALTFVLLGMLAAWRASEAKAADLVWWTGAGLFFGAASWFAYAAVAILPGVVALLSTTLSAAERRRFYGVLVLLGIPALCLRVRSCGMRSRIGFPSQAERSGPIGNSTRRVFFSRCPP